MLIQDIEYQGVYKAIRLIDTVEITVTCNGFRREPCEAYYFFNAKDVEHLIMSEIEITEIISIGNAEEFNCNCKS